MGMYSTGLVAFRGTLEHIQILNSKMPDHIDLHLLGEYEGHYIYKIPPMKWYTSGVALQIWFDSLPDEVCIVLVAYEEEGESYSKGDYEGLLELSESFDECTYYYVKCPIGESEGV